MSELFVTEWHEPEIRVEDCEWYHHYDFLKPYPRIRPHYDLAPIVNRFLLPRDMRGRSFLDIGTANGFFSFEMERRGAQVTSFDVDEDEDLDQIPYAGSPDRRAANKEFTRRLHRGYWYAHRHFKSKARVAYGTAMRLPEWLGQYDVTLLGSILQHLRDPFAAIQSADRHTKSTLIICEAHYESREPVLRFQAQPDVPNAQYWTWWLLSTPFLVNSLKVLGYRDIRVEGPFNLDNIQGQYKVPSVTVIGTKG